MNEDTVERLELKIAYLERATTELSDVVYAQQREIDALRARLTQLASQMEERLQQQDRPYTLEEEKPPHY
jgi:SlyX protein